MAYLRSSLMSDFRCFNPNISSLHNFTTLNFRFLVNSGNRKEDSIHSTKRFNSLFSRKGKLFQGSSESEELKDVAHDIMNVAVPALGVVLSDPLMSLIDTACVGQSNAIQLAALGPNTAIFNFVFQLYTFLGVSTCNLVAKFSSTGGTLEEQQWQSREASSLFSHALIVALVLGVATSFFMESYSGPLLRLMGSKQDYHAPALAYFRIRALSVPAVLVLLVSQGACLGKQDAWTPFIVNTTSAIVNLVGDIVLTLMLCWGAVGAAWATLGSQYFGIALMFMFFRKYTFQDRHAAFRIEKGTAKSMAPSRLTVPLKVGWYGLPSSSVTRQFLMMAGPLILKSVLGTMIYIVMSRIVASSGTLSVAAHQVAMQVFWFLTYIPEALSIAAQSLIARDILAEPKRSKLLAWTILRYSMIVGFILACSILLIHFMGKSLLTSDRAVQSIILTITPQSMLCGLLYPIIGVIEGMAIGSGDLNYLPVVQFMNAAGTIAALLLVSNATPKLTSIWWCLVLSYIMRFIFHLVHIQRTWKNHVLGFSLPL